jgi:predicted nucleic acid-binding protein
VDREFCTVRDYLLEFPVYSISSIDSFISAASLYRKCRKKGVTLRGITDCLIARIAIEQELLLLHKDKDFDRIAGIDKDLRILGGVSLG